jgi:hypothetical protein
MSEFRLDLDDLKVDSFMPKQWPRRGAKGTVFAQNTDPTDLNCTEPGDTCGNTGSCEATCEPMCDSNLGCPTEQTACVWAPPCTSFEGTECAGGTCDDGCGAATNDPKAGCTEDLECTEDPCTGPECPYNR